jgi:hypothetical protein
VAKRFTDTAKWDKEWFMELTPKGKFLWLYIVDACDHAGVWSENYKLASCRIGMEVSRDDLQEIGKNVVPLEDKKVFVPAFIEFQYGQLESSNRAHLSVIRILEKNGIDIQTLAPCKGLISPIQGRKDKDKDKDKEEGGVGETKKPRKRTPKNYTPEFEEVYKQYPRQEGKSQGYKIFAATIVTDGDRQQVRRAIANYTELCRREERIQKHIKHFGTFMGCWKDYLQTIPDLQGGGEQRVKCNECTSGLIRVFNRSSGAPDNAACSCPAGRKRNDARFDPSKHDRIGIERAS